MFGSLANFVINTSLGAFFLPLLPFLVLSRA